MGDAESKMDAKVGPVANTGLDRISVGALTYSGAAGEFSFSIEPE